MKQETLETQYLVPLSSKIQGVRVSPCPLSDARPNIWNFWPSCPAFRICRPIEFVFLQFTKSEFVSTFSHHFRYQKHTVGGIDSGPSVIEDKQRCWHPITLTRSLRTQHTGLAQKRNICATKLHFLLLHDTDKNLGDFQNCQKILNSWQMNHLCESLGHIVYFNYQWCKYKVFTLKFWSSHSV